MSATIIGTIDPAFDFTSAIKNIEALVMFRDGGQFHAIHPDNLRWWRGDNPRATLVGVAYSDGSFRVRAKWRQQLILERLTA